MTTATIANAGDTARLGKLAAAQAEEKEARRLRREGATRKRSRRTTTHESCTSTPISHGAIEARAISPSKSSGRSNVAGRLLPTSATPK